MEDPDVATESFETPSAIEKSPLDFDNKNPSPPITKGKGTEDQAHEIVAPEIPPRNMPATRAASEVSLEEEVAAMEPRLSKKRSRRVNDEADANAPPKVLKKDYASSTRGGKSLPTMGLAAGSTFITPANTKGVSDPDPLSFEIPTENVATMEVQDTRSAESAGSGKSTSSPSMVGSPRDMKKAAETKNADLAKELESLRTQFLDLQMDARLDALSIDFEEELYPHMLTAIAGRRWVIGHDLRLAVIKCTKSIELRQALANVVSAGISKGMSEGLAHGIEHGKAGRGLELEGLKDAPIKVIMASLHLESNLREDAPKWIRELRPSTSQLKIPVYLEVRDPRDPWVVKEEMLLEEAIAANLNRVEKKKRCRVVCRTHGIGSTHHARSDGVLASVPTVTP
nr:hypothetical protein [Tanacetum cinerariifolium]